MAYDSSKLTNLGQMKSALQAVSTKLTTKEDIANKVTSISSTSTDTQYPSAKCVYDSIKDVADANPIIPTGAVDDTSTSTAFTATVPGITELKTGVMMWLTNGVVTSAAGFTLNINNLGAKPVYRGMAAATAETTIFNISYTMAFIYNEDRVEGGCWDTMYYNSNTTYTPPKLGFGYGTCSTAAATVAKVVTLSNYTLVSGGYVSVKFTYAVPASATMNINSKGAKAIYFRGAAITANVIYAGDIATFVYNGSQYHLVAIDRWQNDLAGKESTSNKVTSLSSSTDTQYPSAKCVYDMIGDVESVLTTLLEGSVSLISFQIEDALNSSTYTTYQAEDGMTWAEWVASEYNTIGIIVQSGTVKPSQGGQYWIATPNDYYTSVSSSDRIISSAQYRINFGVN